VRHDAHGTFFSFKKFQVRSQYTEGQLDEVVEFVALERVEAACNSRGFVDVSQPDGDLAAAEVG